MKPKFVKIITLLVLIISNCFLNDLKSQPECHFEHYSTDDGLPQYTIMDLLQDKKGFMWFATWNGLSKFNGYKFVNYKVRPGDSYVMKSNRIEQINEDKYGRIWLRTYVGEAHCFNPYSEKFWGMQLVKGYENYPFQLSQIQIKPSGIVWLLSEKKGCIAVTDSLFNIQIYNQENGRLKGKAVYSVLEETNGNTWLLTDNGLCQIQKGKAQTMPFFFENNHINKNNNQTFYSALELRKEIWFGSNKGRIWKFSKQSGKFTLLNLQLASDIINLKRINQNEVLIITSNDGFLIMNLQTNHFLSFNSSSLKGLKTNIIENSILDKSNHLWLETPNVGIYKFDIKTHLLKYYNIKTDDISTNVFPPRLYVLEDIYHRIWVQPKGGGFSLYNPVTDNLEPFFNTQSSLNWRFSNIVHSAFSDRQGNLWLSTRSHGLEKIVFDKNYFKATILNPNEQRSVSNDVRTVFEDNELNLWIATKDSKLRIYDKNKNLLGFFSVQGNIGKQAELPGAVYSMMQDKDGYIWIGTKGEGIYKIKKNLHSFSYQVQHYKNNPSDVYSLSDNNIYSIIQDKNNHIWIGTYGGGLNLVQTNTTGKTYFINHRNNLKNYPIDTANRLRYITEDKKGHICVGSTSGMIMFSSSFSSPENIQYHFFSSKAGESASLSNNDVHGICCTKRGEMFLVTFGGGINKVIAYDKNGYPSKFKSYTTKNGLPSDVTLAAVEDEQGMLWISTENNLTKFDPEKDFFETYTDIKRLMSRNVFSEASTCRLRSNEIIFGFSGGILSFSPGVIKNNTFVPYISFSKFQLFNKDVSIGGKSPLNEDIDDVKGLVLKHDQNFFSIEFAALDYIEPNNISYAYKLEGFDKDWNYVQKQRIANYTNLPKGDYIFKVKSTSSEGLWMNNERKLPIKILPSFWETPVAYFLYFILFVGLVLLCVYILITIYHLKANVQLEKKMSEMKLRFFTDISHEIRTPLTMITAPVEYLLNDKNTPEPIKKQLKMVSQNTNRMLRLVNQILDFRKIQFLHLKVSEIEIASFVEDIFDNFREIADNQHIKFKFINTAGNTKIWVDPDCLEKIVMNLLSNAFKFTPNGKSIQVAIKKEDKYLSIEVRDQGSGVPHDKQKRLFTRFASFNEDKSKPSTGIGLSLVKDLAEKHSAKVTVESEEGKGSCFTVSFLFGIEHFDKNVEIIAASTNDQLPEVAQSISSRVDYIEPIEDNIKNNSKSSVLVVEDDAELRSFMKSILESEYIIYESEDGADGLEKAIQFCPDFVVSDIMMPRMDGIELLQNLKKNRNTSHIPVILLTSKTTIESKLEGLAYGADDYITKPFSVPYFQARIANLLQQRKQLQDIFRGNLTSYSMDEYNPLPYSINTQDEEMVKKIMELIEENMESSDFTVEDLCQSVNMSRSVFFKKLKSLTGLAPVEFIRDVKMRRAAQILATTKYMIKEVAYLVGISDSKYFTKCFKAKYGMTPLEFKNQDHKTP